MSPVTELFSKCRPVPAEAARRRAWLPVLLVLLLLAGCSGGAAKKPTLQVRVRSNRVAAQPAQPQNLYQRPVEPTGLHATHPSTPTPVPTRPLVLDSAQAVAHLAPTTAPVASPTPTALSLPVARPERIVLPDVGIDAPIVSVFPQQNQVGSQWFQHWQTAAYAAGFHDGSARLGQAGNTVISGHNNIEGSVFRSLYQAEPGQIVQLFADGYRYDYVIEERFVVNEAGASMEQRVQNASWIQTTVDERVTLVSCWPPEGNDYRVIVVARPLREGL